MTDKPVSAEEVIEAAREFLNDPDPGPWDYAINEHRINTKIRLRDILKRYDAQPKPRWLKPEEVKEEGAYWVYLQASPNEDIPARYDGIAHVIHGVRGLMVVDDSASDGMDFTPLIFWDRALFYGPLPEPPPPEEK